jgi:hypothetical protein
MNFHHSTQIKAAFVIGPRSRKELCRVVGLTEKFSVAKERQRLE